MINVSIPNNLITKCQLYRTDQLHNKRGRTKKGHIMIYNKLVQPFAFARFNRKQYPPTRAGILKSRLPHIPIYTRYHEVYMNSAFLSS